MAEQPEKKEQKIYCVCCGGVFALPDKSGEKTNVPIFPVEKLVRADGKRKLVDCWVYICAECQKQHPDAVPRILLSKTVLFKQKVGSDTEILSLPAYGGKQINKP